MNLFFTVALAFLRVVRVSLDNIDKERYEQLRQFRYPTAQLGSNRPVPTGPPGTAPARWRGPGPLAMASRRRDSDETQPASGPNPMTRRCDSDETQPGPNPLTRKPPPRRYVCQQHVLIPSQLPSVTVAAGRPGGAAAAGAAWPGPASIYLL